tara:strand:- start:326 stop:724 length:399 start_codon:yes stop_codon:yes gene_type:complete
MYHKAKRNYALHKMKKMKGYSVKKKFPDLNKDGKITKADVLIGRGVVPKKKNYSLHTKKKFKKHKMYDKNGKEYMANSLADHLRMKKKGYSHKKGYSLVENINRRKKLGISRSKAKSTISAKAYKRMQEGWK